MVCIARFEKPYYSDPVHTAEQAKVAASNAYKWRRAHETKPSLVIQPITSLPEPVAAPEPPNPEPPNWDWLYVDHSFNRAGKWPTKFVNRIKSLVSMEFHTSVEKLESPSRLNSIVIPRHIAIYLCKMLTLKSTPEIARKFGGRDHTTILHAVKQTICRMQKDAYLCQQIIELEQRLNYDLMQWRAF